MTDEMNKCKDCLYWDCQKEILGGRPSQIPMTCVPGDSRTISGGKCRRYSPHPTFAFTREDDWCGEFKLKSETELQ